MTEFRLTPVQEATARAKGYREGECTECRGTGELPLQDANDPDCESTPCECETGRVWGTEIDWDKHRLGALGVLKSDREMARVLGVDS